MRSNLISILAGMILYCTSSPIAGAQSMSQAMPQVSPQAELRQAIYADDFGAVAAMLKAAAGRRRSAEADADTRRLFDVFDTSDPRTSGFTQAWLERSPGSAHAQIARAKSLGNAAWALRGQGPLREIYPTAMRQFLDLNVEAFALAEEAYRDDPDFLPASDAILELGLAAGSKRRAFEVLDATMRRHPNWGTLERALVLSDPDYGGRIGDVTFMCGLYGSMLEAPGEDTTRYCLIRAIHSYFREGNTTLLQDLLSQEPGPSLDDIRAEVALWTWPGPAEDSAFLRSYFDRAADADPGLAVEYDRKVAFPRNHGFVQARVGARAKAAARDRLADDPFNSALLDIVTTEISEVVRNAEGGVSVHLVDPVSLPTRREAARREIVASPFNATYWAKMARIVAAERDAGQDMGQDMGQDTGIAGLLAPDPYAINAIAYSRQKPVWLRQFVASKLDQLDRFDRFDRAAAHAADGDAADLSGIDRQTDILCPLLRADKVLDHRMRVLSATPEGEDMRVDTGLTPRQIDRIAAHKARALASGQCSEVFATPATGLSFGPVPVDLKLDRSIERL